MRSLEVEFPVALGCCVGAGNQGQALGERPVLLIAEHLQPA